MAAVSIKSRIPTGGNRGRPSSLHRCVRSSDYSDRSISVDRKMQVSSKQLGQQVQIGGEKKGTLKFVGTLDGKSGVFCGIELYGPFGMNDGTLKGKTYFVCKPSHGIFAPVERVELLPTVSESESTTSSTASTDDLLSKEIEPPFKSESYLEQFATSFAAPFASTAAAAIFNEPETVIPSSIAPKKISLSDFFDEPGIMEEEPPTDFFRRSFSSVASPGSDPARRPSDSSLPSHDEADVGDDFNEVAIGGDRTPIIDHSLIIADDTLAIRVSPKSEERPCSTVSADTGYHGDTDTSLCGGRVTVSPPPVMDISMEENTMTTASTPTVDESWDIGAKEQPNTLRKENKRNTYTLSKSPINTTYVADSPEITRKQSPTLSVKNDSNRLKSPAAVAASRPPRQKTPSKSQMIMDKLKASLDAEKHKPKKEVQRVSLLPPPKPKPKETEEPVVMTSESKMSQQNGSSTSAATKAKSRQSLLPPKSSKVVISKPRQSLLPPPIPKSAPPPPSSTSQPAVLESTTVFTSAVSKLPRSRAGSISSVSSKCSSSGVPRASMPSSVSATSKQTSPVKIGKQKPPMGPPSRAAPQKPKSAVRAQSSRPNAKSKSQTLPSNKHDDASEEEKEKLEAQLKTGQRRLTYVCQSFDAMSIVSNFLTNRVSDLEMSSMLVRQELEKKNCHIDSLVEAEKRLCDSHLEAIEAVHQRYSKKLKSNYNELSTTHEKEIQKLRDYHDKEKKESIEALKTEHEDQLRLLHEDFDKKTKEFEHKQKLERNRLSHKIKESESEIESLKKEKASLEETLKKDADVKVQRLSAEVQSLGDVLEMKTMELRELRQHQNRLQQLVDEIPEKDSEIQKLRHRVEQLNATIEHKKDTERAIIHKYTEVQLSAHKQHIMSESLLKENEMLEYRLQEMTPGGSQNGTLFYTPSGARPTPRVRSSFSESEHSTETPNHSAINGSKVESFHDVMTRSALSYYQQQGRKRLSVNEGGYSTTIYAPDGIMSDSEFDSFVGSRRGLSFESNSNPDSPKAEGVSARRRSQGSRTEKTVLDSGIFSSTHSELPSVVDIEGAAGQTEANHVDDLKDKPKQA